jgi:E1-E2 ATPase/Cation transporter/ATPase, N-terminus
MVQLLLFINLVLFCSTVSLKSPAIVDNNAKIQIQTYHSSSSSTREDFYETGIAVTLLRPRKTFVQAAFFSCHVLAFFKCLSTVGAPLRNAILALDKATKNGGRLLSEHIFDSEISALPSANLPSARSLVQLLLSLCCHFVYVHLLKKFPRFAKTAKFAETCRLNSATHVLLEKNGDNTDMRKEVIVPLTTSDVTSIDQILSILHLVPTAIRSLNADTLFFNGNATSKKITTLEARTIEFDDMKYFILQDTAGEKYKISSKKLKKRRSRKSKGLKLNIQQIKRKSRKAKESPIIVIATAPIHEVSLNGLKEVHHRLHQFDGNTVSEFGLTSESAAERLMVYGDNNFLVPLPTLGESLLNHFLSPMYVLRTVFQFLSVLEEPIEAPVSRVAMSLFLDSIDVFRLSQNTELLAKTIDGSSGKSEEISDIEGFTVIRDGQLKKIVLAEIVPGDIVYLSDGPVPADCLVLEGSCVVNEAILTGETVPQPKKALDLSALSIIDNTDTEIGEGKSKSKSEDESGNGHLCLGKHHTHILYRGSEIVQSMSVSMKKSEHLVSSKHFRCLVLRTGFSSTQGTLFRKMKALNRRAGGAGEGLLSSRQQKDLIRLLLILSCSALVASLSVYFNGQSRGWSDHRLLVQAARIIVSMASPDIKKDITFTVAASSRRLTEEEKVYCTDPSKIAVAGMVTACLFDKTGTISTDRVVAEKAVTISEVKSTQNVTVPSKSADREGRNGSQKGFTPHQKERTDPRSRHSAPLTDWHPKDWSLSTSPLGLQTVVACCHSVMELLPLNGSR